MNVSRLSRSSIKTESGTISNPIIRQNSCRNRNSSHHRRTNYYFEHTRNLTSDREGNCHNLYCHATIVATEQLLRRKMGSRLFNLYQEW